MEPKQVWELTINTGGDPLKNILTLNDNIIWCSEATVVTSSDQPCYLNIKVPIVDGNLTIRTDTTKPVYREVIVATAKSGTGTTEKQ